MSGDDELREAIAQALADSDASAHGAYTWGECGGELRGDYRRYADAVLALPELEAWVERRARERAAEELTTLAFRLLDQGIPDRVFEEIVAARDALAADALAVTDGTGQP